MLATQIVHRAMFHTCELTNAIDQGAELRTVMGPECSALGSMPASQFMLRRRTKSQPQMLAVLFPSGPKNRRDHPMMHAFPQLTAHRELQLDITCDESATVPVVTGYDTDCCPLRYVCMQSASTASHAPRRCSRSTTRPRARLAREVEWK